MPATEEDLIPDNFTLFHDYVSGAGGTITNGEGGGYHCWDHGSSTNLQDEGKIRFLCDPAHVNYDDPIVYPGQPGAAHLHQFFGNTLTNAYSTYTSLRTTGEGTCQGGRANRTGYWMPAMIRPQGPKVVLPAYIEFYYSQQRGSAIGVVHSTGTYTSPQLPARLFPRGLKFIYGWPWPSSQGNPSGIEYLWSRTDATGGTPGSYLTLPALAAGMPSTGTSDAVAVRSHAPECWDGENLDTSDHRSHMHYFEGCTANPGGYGTSCCPNSHPNRLPGILIIVSYSHNGAGDFGQWYLSSDNGHGAPPEIYPGGTTWHTDWFGAWSNEVLDEFISDRMLGINATPGGVGEIVACNDGTMLHTGEFHGTAYDDAFLKLDGNYYHFFNRPEGNFEENPAYRYLTIPDPPMEHGPGHMSYFGFPLLTLRA